MTRHQIMLLVLAIALTGLVLVPIVMADDTNEQEPEVNPGERLMGSIGAQEAELNSEVNERAFGEAIAAAAADGDTAMLADLINDRIAQNEQELQNLTERLDELEDRLEAGEITRGQFNAEMAKLEVERKSIARTSGEAANAANGLPADVLDEHDINVTAIEELQANASELGGPAVSEIARNIAGPHVGNASPDRPSATDRMVNQVLRSDDANHSIDRAAHWVSHSERTVERITDRAERFNDSQRGPQVDVGEEVWDNLDAATAELEQATSALDNATAALEAGDDEAAIEYAGQAAMHAATATDYANAAAAQLRGPGGGSPGQGGPPSTGPP